MADRTFLGVFPTGVFPNLVRTGVFFVDDKPSQGYP
jgi:hypothetical protein